MIGAAYADAVTREFRLMGFSEGEVLGLLEAAAHVSGMSKEKLEAARERFLREE